MARDLTKADWMRAAVIGASGVLTAAAGIVLTADGWGSAIGVWIVLTTLACGNVWILTGEWAWVDDRAALVLRLLGALGAMAVAVLGLALVSEAAFLAWVMSVALFCGLGAVAAHLALPGTRALAILEASARREKTAARQDPLVADRHLDGGSR